MIAKLGIPILALAAMLGLATPKPAEARVGFGLYFGQPGYYSPYYAPYYNPYYNPYYFYPGYRFYNPGFFYGPGPHHRWR